jgi:NAD-dependent dihydropyrimidine dehydrogenase PreA subunit
MPAVRNIVKIDEEKCTGCGLCVPACEEGAIQIIDGKARLVSEIYCDGLGNCLGKCPEDAITIEQREAEAFDLSAVERHLEELGSEHPEPHSPVAGGCPGSRVQDLRGPVGSCPGSAAQALKSSFSGRPGGPHGVQLRCPGSVAEAIEREEAEEAAEATPREPQLGNWPVQLRLVPVEAPYFDGADLLIAADCVPFAYPEFHERLLSDHALVIGCPKLDDVDLYVKKLAQIIARNDIKAVRVAHMEVPCCFGLVHIVSEALKESGKAIPAQTVQIGIRGEVQETKPLLAGITA